jgi:hypothetical protein
MVLMADHPLNQVTKAGQDAERKTELRSIVRRICDDRSAPSDRADVNFLCSFLLKCGTALVSIGL